MFAGLAKQILQWGDLPPHRGEHMGGEGVEVEDDDKRGKKTSFCSESCDDCHVTTKLQILLKKLQNFLDSLKKSP